LVDNQDLGRRFRDRYLKGIRNLIKIGKLNVEDQVALDAILSDVSTRDWVVYIEPPPRDDSDPTHVIKYLALYMTGGPISDRQLIEEKDGRICFWARSDDKSGRQEIVSLPVLEFVRRWTTHILPKGFTKSRCYGGWSNTRRKEFQRQCQSIRPNPDPPVAGTPIPAPESPVAAEANELQNSNRLPPTAV